MWVFTAYIQQLIILGGCSIALSQGHFTYRHDKVLHFLATELLKHFAGNLNLPGMQASDSPGYNSSFPASYFILPRSSNLQQGQQLNLPLGFKLSSKGCMLEITSKEYLEIIS